MVRGRKKKSRLRWFLEASILGILFYKLAGVAIAWIWTHRVVFAAIFLGVEIIAYLVLKNWIMKLMHNKKFRIFRIMKKIGKKF